MNENARPPSGAAPAASWPGLLPFDEALAALLASALAKEGTEHVPTMDGLHRVLAQDIVSSLNVPPMDNTQMDGYALNTADLSENWQEQVFPVSQRVPAGKVGSQLQPTSLARIFTGAMIPPGADAVIMQEQVEVLPEKDAGGQTQVRIKHRPRPGEWIRRIGEDIRAESVILQKGTILSANALGLAASVGIAHLPVKARVKVACFFTGDELTLPGEPLKPGAIYNSNRFVIVNSLRELGCEVFDLGIVPDSLEATRQALRTAANQADLIITSGGVSVGEEDHVKPAVNAEGSLHLWQIAMKPGKPLAYGKVRRNAADAPSTAHFIGLPGNPVSSLVTFWLFVKPFIRILQGADGLQAQGHLNPVMMRADFALPKADKRREFLRVKINAQGGLDVFTNQSSAVLTSTVWADGLLDNPPMQTIAPGDMVRFIPFHRLLS